MSDWTAAQDESGRTYYYNSATQQTSWEAPPGFADAAAAPSAPAAAAAAAAPSADAAWTEVKDASTGKSYYVNSVTNATQWDPPPGFGGGGAAAPSAGAGAAAGSRAPAAAAAAAAVKAAPKRAPASAEPQTVDEKLAARAKKFLAARRQEKARAQPSACAFRPLPRRARRRYAAPWRAPPPPSPAAAPQPTHPPSAHARTHRRCEETRGGAAGAPRRRARKRGAKGKGRRRRGAASRLEHSGGPGQRENLLLQLHERRNCVGDAHGVELACYFVVPSLSGTGIWTPSSTRRRFPPPAAC
jgi:hypothetical protein